MPSLQAPLPSGFGPATTAREVLRGLDLSGQVAIVTGGYSGVAPVLPPEAPGTVGVRPHAIDPRLAERLWTLSEGLTGVRFPA